MTRLNISFHAHVPTLHPSVLMTLLSLLSVLKLFGISVTLAPPSLTDLDPSHVLTTLSPILSDEAKRALNLTAGPSHVIANLAPALSTEAKSALSQANINPADAIASLAPVLTDDASKVLNQVHINPADAVASVVPADLSKSLHHLPGLDSPFQAPTESTIFSSSAGPLEGEALNALTHATTETISSSNTIASQPHISPSAACVPSSSNAATAMHNDISAQVSKGNLSKEGALAAHKALYEVLSPRIPKLAI